MTVSFERLRIEIGARVLLAEGVFRMGEGEKVALVGPNGAGKTTLLRTLAGELAPASGSMRLPASVGWLPQETRPTDSVGSDLVLDHLLDASPLTGLKTRLDRASTRMGSVGADLDEAIADFGELEEAFRRSGGYELESEAERIAAGLGLDTDILLRQVVELSGGQRRRLELARLLLSGAELLILDEPTNHLDGEAKAFVMEFLRTTPSGVLTVSHDIELMSESIDRVLALEDGRLDSYRGTYSQFLAKRAQREEATRREAVNAQREMARLSRTADRFRQGNATAARKRKALERRIDRIARSGAQLAPVKRRKLTVRFPEPERSGDVVLEVRRLGKALGGNAVLQGVDFTVGRGEVFLVVGPNGAGKTTLLRCLAGVYQPDDGQVRTGARVTVGYYAQEHEDISADQTVLEVMTAAAPDSATVSELRGVLAHFGLVGEMAEQPAATLSGGERTKLSLARLVAGGANLLLLDEPTNNLDPQSREAVLAALQHFRGTVVLVSHDLEFVTQLEPEHAIVLPSGRHLPFDAEMVDLVADRGLAVASTLT